MTKKGKKGKKGKKVPKSGGGGVVAAMKPAPEIITQRLDENRLLLRKNGPMRVDGLVYASPEMISGASADANNALAQVAAVACLPGIIGRSYAMPDIHWGYGFPIGGVAAFDAVSGIISPGGVGYDINCGCRLMATGLSAHELTGRLPGLMDALMTAVPSGLGRGGDIKLTNAALKQVLKKGAGWAVAQGLGRAEDLANIEDQGSLSGADPAAVSERAMERGRPQLGTLGSGNHFIELDVVEEIFDPDRAGAFGLAEGQLVIQIHSGSRGLGYQVCDDALKKLIRYAAREGLTLPDRQLVYAPLGSHQAEEYLAGMNCAANYAFANRQVLGHLVEEALLHHLQISPAGLKMRLVIDVCHNIAKMESHTVDGVERLLCVHRKGATRAFAAGRPELPEAYKATGQPVLIPGDMGRASYLLAGQQGAMERSFGSTCHGAGRLLSRQAAKNAARGRLIDEELAEKGIIIRAEKRATLAEEMPAAYKDAAQVVEVVHRAGLSTKVARLRPLGVIKG